MFSLLCVKEPQRKIFGGRRCAVEMLLSPVKGAAPYKVINVTPGKNGIDWRCVANAAGNTRRSMLIPDSVLLPLSAEIEPFVPQVLPLLIMLNTAVQFCAQTPESSIAVVDKRAVLPDYISRVVPHVGKVTVVTDEPEKYYPCAADIMEDFGAAIIIRSEINEDEKFDVCVGSGKLPNAEITFDADCIGKSDFEVDIPDEYTRMCPEKIDTFLFVCALFECCGLKRAGDLTLKRA